MADTSTPAPKTKKLPFKATALKRAASIPKPSQDATSLDADDDDGLDIFRRSREMTSRIEAERQKQMRRKQKMERRRSSEAMSEQNTPRAQRVLSPGRTEVDESMTVATESFDSVASPSPSRRTIAGSLFSPDAQQQSSGFDVAIFPSTQLLDPEPQPELPPPPSPSPLPRSRTSPRKAAKPAPVPMNATIISLDSDSEEDIKPEVIPGRKLRQSSSDIEMLEEVPTPSSQTQQDTSDIGYKYVREAEEREHERRLAAEKKESAFVNIRPHIGGSTPLRFKYLLDKPLQHLINVWLMKQPDIIKQETRLGENILLTWNGQRVYSSVTIRSLGISLDQVSGRLVTKSGSRRGLGDNENETSVYFELWLPEQFARYEEEQAVEQERERRRQAGEISDDEPEPEPEPEVKIRVVLRTREGVELRFTGRPRTTIEELIMCFRSQKGVGPEQEVMLWFDGEALGSDVTLENADIEDTDVIEVHLK